MPAQAASWIARCSWRRLAQRTRLVEEHDLAESAIVFSPHYDDECLGCGGTLVRKSRAGAALTLVFMTDGTGSHRGAMPVDEIRRVRHDEGNAAARALGVPPGSVRHLNFPETQLARFRSQAAERIAELLQATRPKAIFVPFRGEPRLWSDDHLATTHSVFAALRHYHEPVKIYEFPIWYWFQWPWVHPSPRRRREARIILRNSVALRRGPHNASRLNTCSRIAEVLPAKWAALNQHASQMTRLMRERPWPTLHDVGGGQFLSCFFQPCELFAVTLQPAEIHSSSDQDVSSLTLSASNRKSGTHTS